MCYDFRMYFRELFSTHRARIFFLTRYIISGLVGAAVQMLFLFVWVTLLGFEKTYLLGLVLGFVAAYIVSFMLQKYWAFHDYELHRLSRQLFLYAVVAVSGLALNTILLAGTKRVFEWFSIDFFHGWYLLVQASIILLVAAFNFCMNFIFTFRHARRERLWNP